MNMNLDRARFGVRTLTIILGGLTLCTIGCGSEGAAVDSEANGGKAGVGDQVGAGMSGSVVAAVAGSAANGGRSGTDTTSNAGAPGVVSTLGEHSIASTGRGSCALDGQGAIHCWGGLSAERWAIPVGQFVELHASSDEICAVRTDGSVECFVESGLAAGGGAAELLPAGKVTQLALQRGAVCGIDGSGSPFCNSSNSIPVPLTVPLGAVFSMVSVGGYFACGIRAQAGSILCWGYPGDNSCAWVDPMTGQLDAPAGEFVSISSGLFSSCAIEKSGKVHCWGAGDASDDPNLTCRGFLQNFGQSIPPEGMFRSISVGANHVCGVKTDGTVACWGAGTTDEGCQDAGENCRQSRPPAGKFDQVSVGNYHSCAMTAERKVQCWGYPGAGPGDGRLTPPAEFQ